MKKVKKVKNTKSPCSRYTVILQHSAHTHPVTPQHNPTNLLQTPRPCSPHRACPLHIAPHAIPPCPLPLLSHTHGFTSSFNRTIVQLWLGSLILNPILRPSMLAFFHRRTHIRISHFHPEPFCPARSPSYDACGIFPHSFLDVQDQDMEC